MYAAANGTVPLVNIDGNSAVLGSANAQTGGPFGVNSTTGNFAVNFTGTNLSSGLEEDLTGSLTADGAGNLTGSLDINNGGSLFQAIPLASSTYTLSSNGHGSTVIVTSPAVLNLQTYQVSPNTVLFLDVDQGRVLTGVMQK